MKTIVQMVAALGKRGGTIDLDAKTYEMGGVLSLDQIDKPVIIRGKGAHWIRDPDLEVGTIIDCDATEGDHAHMFLHSGSYVCFRDITFRAVHPGAIPFVYVAESIVAFERNLFLAAGGGPTAVQDGIRLGGAQEEPRYRGYGSRIVGNMFEGIRRCVDAGMESNGLIVRENMIHGNCGSAGDDAAITVNGHVTNPAIDSFSVGAQVKDNVIEIYGYKYGIALDGVRGMVAEGNTFYDHTEKTTAAYYLGPNFISNTVHVAWRPLGLQSWHNQSVAPGSNLLTSIL